MKKNRAKIIIAIGAGINFGFWMQDFNSGCFVVLILLFLDLMFKD